MTTRADSVEWFHANPWSCSEYSSLLCPRVVSLLRVVAVKSRVQVSKEKESLHSFSKSLEGFDFF